MGGWTTGCEAVRNFEGSGTITGELITVRERYRFSRGPESGQHQGSHQQYPI